MMMKSGVIIIIVAPSGSGKSTLLKEIFKKYRILKWSVSTTTRAARLGESHGRDYFFSNEINFKRGIDERRFVEWAKVHGNYYGTSKEYIDHCLYSKDVIVCDLDVQGAIEMKRLYPRCSEAIFIEPPSLSVLADRLKKRGSESEESLRVRVKNAEQELKFKNDFDFLVKNDSLDHAQKALENCFDTIIKKYQQ
jgi:guanylate kinase